MLTKFMLAMLVKMFKHANNFKLSQLLQTFRKFFSSHKIVKTGSEISGSQPFLGQRP